MKKLLIIFTLFVQLIYSSLLQAQTISWGNEYTMDPKVNTHSEIQLFNDGTNTYIKRRADGVSFQFEKYDAALKQIFSKTIQIPELNGQPQYCNDFKLVKGKFTLFAASGNKKQTTITIYDLSKDGVLSTNYVEVPNNKDIVDVYADTSAAGTGNILLLSYQSETFSNENKELTYAILRGGEVPTLIQTGSFNIPFLTEGGFKFTSILLGYDNSIHAICHVTKVKAMRDKTRNFYQEFFSYYPASKELKTYNLFPNNQCYTKSSEIKFISPDQLIIAGFYSVVEQRMFEGVFYATIDTKAKNIISKYNAPIDASIRALFENTWYDDFKVHIYPRSDGGMYWVAENEFISLNGNAMFYNYRHILLIEFDSKNVLKKATCIPKSQYNSKSNNFLSYTYFKNRNEHTFIFNDVIANQTIDEPAKIKNVVSITGMIPYTTKADEEGKILSKKELNLGTGKVLFLKPAYFINLGNSCIVYAEKDKIFSLGRIIY